MNAHARRTRRQVARRVGRQLALEAIVVTAAASAGLFAIGRLGSSWAVAVLVGEFVAVGHLVSAWSSNPVSRTFLADWLDAPEALGGVPFDPVEGRDLRSIGLSPSFSLAAHLRADDDRSAPAYQVAFDVHAAGSGMVVALAGRHSSSLTLVSRLSDGRLAVTADQAIPPHSALVTAVAPSIDPDIVAAAHRDLLTALIDQRCRPVPATPELAWELVKLEREAWEGIGPLVGPLFSLSGRSKPFRLGVGVEPNGPGAVGRQDQRGETDSSSASVSRNSNHTTARTPERV